MILSLGLVNLLERTEFREMHLQRMQMNRCANSGWRFHAPGVPKLLGKHTRLAIQIMELY